MENTVVHHFQYTIKNKWHEPFTIIISNQVETEKKLRDEVLITWWNQGSIA